MTAEIHILSEGYLGDGDDRVGSTVGFARDGGVLVVTDPGLVPGARRSCDRSPSSSSHPIRSPTWCSRTTIPTTR
jgi:hypothetical protein